MKFVSFKVPLPAEQWHEVKEVFVAGEITPTPPPAGGFNPRFAASSAFRLNFMPLPGWERTRVGGIT